MDFKNELAKYGYSANNSIPVETLVNEILPKLFSVQNEKKYSEENMKKSFEAGRKGYIRGSMLHKEYYFTWKSFNDWLKKFKNK